MVYEDGEFLAHLHTHENLGKFTWDNLDDIDLDYCDRIGEAIHNYQAENPKIS